MPFDINQLNNLDYDEAEPLLADYIDGNTARLRKNWGLYKENIVLV